MTIQGSGEIDIGDLQTEFGGTNPASLSEYYRGSVTTTGYSSNVGPHNTGLPTSGTISLNQFYNTEAVRTLTISNTQDNYDVKAALGNPSGAVSVYVDITSSGICRGSTNSNYGLTISGFASGSFVFINNAGYIVGKGGQGGYYSDSSNPHWAIVNSFGCGDCTDNKGFNYCNTCCRETFQTGGGGTSVGNGGPAMYIQSGISVYVRNTGVIGGGGGGGGSAGAGNNDCSSSSCGGVGGGYGGPGGGGAGYGASATSNTGYCNGYNTPKTSTAGGLSTGGAGATGEGTGGTGGALGVGGGVGARAGGNVCGCTTGSTACSGINCNNTQSTFGPGLPGGAAGAATSGYSNVTSWITGGVNTANFKGNNG